MSEELPDYLKMKLMRKFMSKIAAERKREEKPLEEEDPEKIVWGKLADERARELMYKAKKLYPDKYPLAIQVFYLLLRDGKVKEFDGYTTLLLLHRLEIPVKPELRIKFVKHGKEVDMSEYLGTK
jgi:hypothetical protein